jgi:hypothetical protein
LPWVLTADFKSCRACFSASVRVKLIQWATVSAAILPSIGIPAHTFKTMGKDSVFISQIFASLKIFVLVFAL